MPGPNDRKTKMDEIPPVNGTLTPDERTELDALRALKAGGKLNGNGNTLKLKFSLKTGAVILYGLGQFPVTLYKAQWIRLLDIADQIRAFLDKYSEYISTDRTVAYKPPVAKIAESLIAQGIATIPKDAPAK